MSIKVAQKWFHYKYDIFWHLHKYCLRKWEIWTNNFLQKASKTCPKSNKSPNLVTLLLTRSISLLLLHHQLLSAIRSIVQQLPKISNFVPKIYPLKCCFDSAVITLLVPHAWTYLIRINHQIQSNPKSPNLKSITLWSLTFLFFIFDTM